MNNIIGRYTLFNTTIHRLDARVKFLSLILLMVCVFLEFETWATTFIIDGALFILIITLLLICRVSPLNILKSLLSMWLLIIFLLVFNVFFPPNREWIAFSIDNFNVYWDSILQSLKIILRLLMMFSLTLILTASTKSLDLTHALEWYMYPLKLIRFPVHIVSMMTSLALRFIPTLIEDARRIMRAQASRGLDYNKGSLRARLRGITALIIPLFVSAFSRSEELSNAMIARGYDPYAKRTRYQSLTFHWRDLFAFLIVAGIFAAFLTATILRFDILRDWFMLPRESYH